ncbi:MAG TPA: sigma-70 family RNA polymerase sigma factor [Spirochaetota bacterium]|nr:sigma-70 family RNA polymerase sigma factor [Spirochaetota bacterium]HPC41149.1 sigma-70 family RNA polymerase sigma factor [Spirochaetota bacterium]HPL15571.1 sigma-70 family RNA polymerase sigma factor [Spirochaetota bacterium]HQF07069.1 sigma-70 family RNA polymerase sigma factor [Spirochaetota bacterium]HQH95806.1 sigma-70 family RNA polymerase sigma factor [Spirochaetota bacterium]
MNAKTNSADFDEVFSVNYRLYAAAVIRFLRRIVHDLHVSEEICQDVFLRVYEKRIDLDPESPQTLNFFFTAAKNAAIDFIRRKRCEEEKLRSIQVEEAVLDRQFYEDIENMCLRGEVLSTLSDVISGFPENRRAVVAARCIDGRPAASLARESGMSAYHVRKIEREAHRKIRSAMERYFGDTNAQNRLDRKKYSR